MPLPSNATLHADGTYSIPTVDGVHTGGWIDRMTGAGLSWALVDELAARRDEDLVAVVFHLVNLYRINADLGHARGDEVIEDIFRRLVASAPGRVYRVGGGTFVLLWPRSMDPAARGHRLAREAEGKVLDAIRAELPFADPQLVVRVLEPGDPYLRLDDVRPSHPGDDRTEGLSSSGGLNLHTNSAAMYPEHARDEADWRALLASPHYVLSIWPVGQVERVWLHFDGGEVVAAPPDADLRAPSQRTAADWRYSELREAADKAAQQHPGTLVDALWSRYDDPDLIIHGLHVIDLLRYRGQEPAYRCCPSSRMSCTRRVRSPSAGSSMSPSPAPPSGTFLGRSLATCDRWSSATCAVHMIRLPGARGWSPRAAPERRDMNATLK